MDKNQIARKSNHTMLLAAFTLLAVAHLGAAAPHSNHHQSTTATTTTTTQTTEQTTVTANTTSGLLRGIRQQTIIKFLAVPYAEAPIGSLRFKRPVEYNRQQQQQQELNASQFGRTCPQYRHLTQFISPLLNIDSQHQTSEDCLHLNVFVPASVGQHTNGGGGGDNQLEPNKQLPVIVWIPGEGFDFADARQFDGSHLAQKTQSIVVTVQYRVGVLGFLHAPKLNITGNMGVYDQLMALRWVHRNIRAFGGDPERVTLMGRFSGSMSISAMITAPRQQELLHDNNNNNNENNNTKQQLLFNRVALLSGIAVEDWIIDASQHERVAHLEESALTRAYCTSAQLEDGTCLGSMSVEQLMQISDYGWRLVRDNELIGERSPIEAIKSSEFSSELEGVLLGETAMEGTLCLYRHALNSGSSNYAQLIDEDKLSSQDLYNVIRDDSQTYFRYNANKTNPIEMALGSLIEQTTSAAAAADQLGSSSGTVPEQDSRLRDKYLNACSAYMVKSHANRFKRNILASNQLLENRRPNSNRRPTEVYHYELRYKPSFSLAPDYIRTAAHGDDIPLIFGLIYNQPRNEINEADLVMTRKMMSYIGNFVHGNQPLLSTSQQQQPSVSVVGLAEEDDNVDLSSSSSSVAINMKPPRSWASEGQLHHIEFEDSDLQELKANSQRQRAQSRHQSAAAANNGAEEVGDKSGVRAADKSLNIRLFFVDNINQQPQQQLQQLQESNEIFVQRRQQLRQPQQQQQQQQQQVLPAQQTNMTLINESSFVTMLLFGTCLVLFALMSTCLGLCLIIFRSSAGSHHHSFGSGGKPTSLLPAGHHQHNHHHHQQQQLQQHQRYANHSSTSSCNICEDSQVANNANSIDAVLGGAAGVGDGGARCKADDARTFSNVFAKLSRNQTSQSHQPIDGQSHHHHHLHHHQQQEHKQTE